VNLPLGIRGSARSRARTEEPGLTLGALIYVVSVALVAAATTVSFGIASFSFLDTRKMPRGDDIRDRRTELKPLPSDVVPRSDEKAAPVPAEAKVSSMVVEETLRASAQQRPAAFWTGTMPTRPLPAEQRDQVFREFEMYNSQKVKMDGDKAASKGEDRSREK
jgi:hypothetical protein